ncbi:hypothetical protein BMF35_a0644 [Aurantiacibacter gangjinensis]|nr:hypothetical protein BMF35_a0644 [Aurantiacibacter gangjinensis]
MAEGACDHVRQSSLFVMRLCRGSAVCKRQKKGGTPVWRPPC